MVAALAWRNGIAMWTGRRVPEEGADAFIEFGADDVLEFASLAVRFVVVNPKSVLKESLRKTMAAHNVTGTAAAAVGKLHFGVFQNFYKP